MKEESIGDLFKCILQHLKCIEIRLDYAKCATSFKQKHTINQAILKTKSAIDTLCSLLPNSESILNVKKDLEKEAMLYVMVMIEKFSSLPLEDLEELDNIIESYIVNKQIFNTDKKEYFKNSHTLTSVNSIPTID